MSSTSADTITAQLVLPLTESTRELLTLMHWGDIPEEAKTIVFFEDGNAQYLSNELPVFLSPGETFTVMIMAKKNYPLTLE